MNQVLVGIAGSGAVALAVWVTGSAVPLWALIFVAMMIESCDKTKKEVN